jgi:peroxiredoxin
MVCGVAAAGLAVGVVGCDRGSRPSQIGQAAPVFALNDGAQTVDLAKLRGRVVVLNFWASWCAPCVQEMPSLVTLQRELPQVQVLGVSTDEDAAAYQSFLQHHELNFMTVRDAAQKSNALYGTFRYPETYVIDKEGRVRRKFIGPQDWTSPEIVDFLKKLSAGQ